MTLDDWRLDEGLTFARLAALLSEGFQPVTPETVRRWCLPEGAALSRMPDAPWLRRIYDVTGGKVTPNDFAGIPEQE